MAWLKGLKKTLKNMLKRFVSETGKDWDKWLPYLLFAYREVPQAATGFSPFELLYAHPVRGPLDVLRENWEAADKLSQINIVSYVLKMREQLEKTTAMARQNLLQNQARQKEWYDRTARTCSFEVGDEVLLLLPTSENKLLTKWQGPYRVQRKVGSVTYEVHIPSRSKPLQIFHVNLLKKWHARPPSSVPPTAINESSPEQTLFIRAVEEEEDLEEQYFPVLRQTAQLDLSQLSEHEQRQVLDLIPPDLFKETPGLTNLVSHHITLHSSKPIRQPVYRIPERLLPIFKEELETMLSLGVIEPSASESSSPVILVPKKDGSLSFCLDFRKVNSVSKFDSYPMLRVDDLVERLG